ncbi:MAG: ribosome recycling factor, partial [Sedimentisphaerales bacterium]
MPVKQIITDSEAKMKKAVDVLQDELKGVRTGRASTGLVENIRVEYYGNPTPLKALAALSTPQPDMILVKPFDPGSIK